jgi:hypothetical protein
VCIERAFFRLAHCHGTPPRRAVRHGPDARPAGHGLALPPLSARHRRAPGAGVPPGRLVDLPLHARHLRRAADRGEGLAPLLRADRGPALRVLREVVRELRSPARVGDRAAGGGAAPGQRGLVAIVSGALRFAVRAARELGIDHVVCSEVESETGCSRDARASSASAGPRSSSRRASPPPRGSPSTTRRSTRTALRICRCSSGSAPRSSSPDSAAAGGGRRGGGRALVDCGPPGTRGCSTAHSPRRNRALEPDQVRDHARHAADEVDGRGPLLDHADGDLDDAPVGAVGTDHELAGEHVAIDDAGADQAMSLSRRRP